MIWGFGIALPDSYSGMTDGFCAILEASSFCVKPFAVRACCNALLNSSPTCASVHTTPHTQVRSGHNPKSASNRIEVLHCRHCTYDGRSQFRRRVLMRWSGLILSYWPYQLHIILSLDQVSSSPTVWFVWFGGLVLLLLPFFIVSTSPFAWAFDKPSAVVGLALFFFKTVTVSQSSDCHDSYHHHHHHHHTTKNTSVSPSHIQHLICQPHTPPPLPAVQNQYRHTMRAEFNW